MKKAIIFAVFILSLFGLSACTGQSSDNNEIKNTQNTGDINIQRPERTSDIAGVIRSINGNEMLVALMNRSAQSEVDPNTEESDSKSSADLSSALSRTSGGMRPGGGGGTGAGSDMSEADRLAMILEKSEENVKVLVPVGIAMIKGGAMGAMDEEEAEVEVASFSDLVAGKTVNVWLDQAHEDRKVAEFISVR